MDCNIKRGSKYCLVNLNVLLLLYVYLMINVIGLHIKLLFNSTSTTGIIQQKLYNIYVFYTGDNTSMGLSLYGKACDPNTGSYQYKELFIQSKWFSQLSCHGQTRIIISMKELYKLLALYHVARVTKLYDQISPKFTIVTDTRRIDLGPVVQNWVSLTLG